MKARNTTLEDILIYLYCSVETLKIIREDLDCNENKDRSVDALHGEIYHLNHMCEQLSKHIQKMPNEWIEKIAAAVAGNDNNQ